MYPLVSVLLCLYMEIAHPNLDMIHGSRTVTCTTVFTLVIANALICVRLLRQWRIIRPFAETIGWGVGGGITFKLRKEEHSFLCSTHGPD